MCQISKESNQLRLKLNKKEQKALIHVRDRDCKPYRRERAAALLKIAAGQSPHAVAQSGLLKKRSPDTVYSWLKVFVEDGIKGLGQKKRQKPSRLTSAEQEELMEILTTKTPIDYGGLQSRWSLAALLCLIPFLGSSYRDTSSIWHLLKRLNISYKRGRDSQSSPDVAKALKIRRIRAYLGDARKNPGTVVMLFLDEFSFYRQPKIGKAWWPKGRRKQPPAIRSYHADTRGRIVGAINAVTGEVTYQMASSIRVNVFCDFLATLAEKHSDFSKIYLVLDNWPTVHKHPQTLATFEQLRIMPLFLPTYSPESNPIEKVWGELTAKVLKLHRYSGDWATLKQKVAEWLEKFLTPSETWLQMVGLLKGRAIACNP